MKKAFTLAEVLITLGIIGVVAAMTLPTLIQNQQKRSLEVATQKFYSTMSQAVKKYMADEGVDDLRNTPIAGSSGETDEVLEKLFLNKYLKIVKKCKNTSECFASQYRGWDGTGERGIPENYDFGYGDTYILSDGSVIKIDSDVMIDIWVDVNGKKGPNRVGYDLWSMSLYYDGVIEESSIGPECRGRIDSKYNDDFYKCEEKSAHEKREERFENCKNSTYGGCFGHFLENNFKFDY